MFVNLQVCSDSQSWRAFRRTQARASCMHFSPTALSFAHGVLLIQHSLKPYRDPSASFLMIEYSEMLSLFGYEPQDQVTIVALMLPVCSLQTC